MANARPGTTDYGWRSPSCGARVAAIRAGTAGELVWLVEHPPLYTAGTSAAASDLQDADRFPTYQAGRGGQWTYHGPGQRVAYVMLDLHADARQRSAARHPRLCRRAGELGDRAPSKRFGIKGETREGRVGIWVVTADGARRKSPPSACGSAAG